MSPYALKPIQRGYAFAEGLWRFPKPRKGRLVPTKRVTRERGTVEALAKEYLRKYSHISVPDFCRKRGQNYQSFRGAVRRLTKSTQRSPA